ncbi:ubiquitin domain-containing protein UBFD1-like isoform X1 [Macrosteles quadrilineatus]|uniref:ubiquitin domain-containing protein UBFD1-like isoform X1 n=1 Tax=Macrosteles quadrilineatus TaxID=74068 RepID=UPI0023E289FD|nr:ubiquitin domain-containing protein UBFD1-like isoform X1 [Macrosteles quadrilineatus]
MENPAGDAGDAKDEVNNKPNCEYVIKNHAKETAIEPIKMEPNLPAAEIIDFTVIYNKNKHDVQFPLDDNVGQLKKHLEDVIGVPHSLQKVMIKGLAKDERTLRELGVTKGMKVMVVGSKLNDVIAVSTHSSQDVAGDDNSNTTTTKEPFCRQKMHRKVLDKGLPDDVMPGIKDTKEALPPFPLVGMLNKSGGKVRLTFKLEMDQVWIGTKERTDKIPMNSIKSIVSEPIEGFEQYHVMGLQMGTTEASRYWVYWVPAQYVDSIKDAILGTWML